MVHMGFYFIYVHIKLPQHEYYRKGFKLGERVVPVAVFAYHIGLEDTALVVIEESLLFDAEDFCKFAGGEVLLVFFHV